MWEEDLAFIQDSVRRGPMLFTHHADLAAQEEGIGANEIREAILNGRIIENYPAHRRGPCCLIAGYTASDRPIHVVATIGLDPVVIITVYEPRQPWWVTPTQRGHPA